MFNNLRELITSLNDEAACKSYLASQRWENGKAVCPYCSNSKCYDVYGATKYKCAKCRRIFSVTVGTIFEDSNLPLKTWFMALYLIGSHKKSISSYQLAKDLGISQKASWFVIHRLREMMREKTDVKLDMIVETDESWTGGKMKNKHVSVRTKAHLLNTSHTDNKTGFLGYLQREGTLKMQKMNPDKTLKQQVADNVLPEAVIITDNSPYYVGLNKMFEGHASVDHKKDEFVRGYVHTNSIEGAFGLFKRCVYGTWHHISPKHLDRYLDEFTYKYNSRKIKDAERFKMSMKRVEGRLDYKTLTGKK